MVPCKGRQVPEIEDERVAQRDRLGEPAVRRQHLEDPIRACPCIGEPVRHHLNHVIPSAPVVSSSACTWHRSEEHTSELQSRLHLVCRLLLEKKKKKSITTHTGREKHAHRQ